MQAHSFLTLRTYYMSHINRIIIEIILKSKIERAKYFNKVLRPWTKAFIFGSSSSLAEEFFHIFFHGNFKIYRATPNSMVFDAVWIIPSEYRMHFECKKEKKNERKREKIYCHQSTLLLYANWKHAQTITFRLFFFTNFKFRGRLWFRLTHGAEHMKKKQQLIEQCARVCLFVCVR